MAQLLRRFENIIAYTAANDADDEVGGGGGGDNDDDGKKRRRRRLDRVAGAAVGTYQVEVETAALVCTFIILFVYS